MIPKVSRTRERQVARMVRRESRDPSWVQLTPDARLMYVLGALLANDAGVVKKSVLREAFQDERITARATEILAAVAAAGEATH